MPSLFSELEAQFAWQGIARRAVRRVFRPSLFERVDDALKHWEGYFEGARWELWEQGGARAGRSEWTWEDLDAYDNLRGDWLSSLAGAFERARALLHLCADRGKDSNDANCFSIPSWFEAFIDDDSAEHSDAFVDRAYEWVRQRASDGYYAFGETQWMRRIHCIKAALCLVANRGRPPAPAGDPLACYRDVVDSLAIWDDGSFEYEAFGTTLEVGEGVFRNWWFDIGSL